MTPVAASNPAEALRRPTRKSVWRGAQFGLSQSLYENFRRLIYDESGIWLGDSREALLCGRLSKRLRALELATLADYYEIISRPDEHVERIRMIDAITTNATHFFREPKHFEVLEQEILPRWRGEAERGLRPKKIRIWSAACSSGEEPYSLAMLLANHLPPSEGWDVEILATDISTRMLEKARQGIYTISGSLVIPKHLLHQFMLKGIAAQAGNVKMAPEIQQMVRFMRINLAQSPYPFDTTFDLIFCRNVLIYFDKDSKRKVADNLARCLSANGFLIIGHAENLNGVTSAIRNLAPTIYCQPDSYKRLLHDFRRT